MDAFTFYNPTTLDFGADKERLIGGHMAGHGVKKVLLCYGSERVKRDGLFGAVTASLTEHGIQWAELGGIVSNPLISKVREGIELARTQQVDAILAVGGGSVLDSVKAIAAGVPYAGDVWDLFTGKAAIATALPLFAVLTLAATGSEMNPGAVVTNDDTREKFFIMSPALFPKVSVVSPVLMRSVSREYLVYSASDVIAHLIEIYFTATAYSNLQSRLVEALINTVIETTEALLADPLNDDARAQFAWAATLALNGVVSSGAGGYGYPNHAIEHALSALYNVPHGAGLSVVVPAWMTWFHSRNPGQFQRFAQTVFGVETAEQGIAALKAWFDKVGTPTRLSQLNIAEADIPAIAENALGNMAGFGLAKLYTRDVITAVLNNAV